MCNGLDYPGLILTVAMFYSELFSDWLTGKDTMNNRLLNSANILFVYYSDPAGGTIRSSRWVKTQPFFYVTKSQYLVRLLVILKDEILCCFLKGKIFKSLDSTNCFSFAIDQPGRSTHTLLSCLPDMRVKINNLIGIGDHREGECMPSYHFSRSTSISSPSMRSESTG